MIIDFLLILSFSLSHSAERIELSQTRKIEIKLDFILEEIICLS